MSKARNLASNVTALGALASDATALGALADIQAMLTARVVGHGLDRGASLGRHHMDLTESAGKPK